jgi:hypothetical protein
MNNKKIYYISNIDNCIHNLKDVQHELFGEDNAYIGEMTDNGFEVQEEVDLHSLKEILEIYK